MNRRRRGVAVLSTALLCTVAVGAALVLVTATMRTTRSEAVRIEAAETAAIAEDALETFSAALAVDPWFFHERVHELERARVCPALDGLVIEPGEPWPAGCGAHWNYVAAAEPNPVRIEVSPPGPFDPHLHVRVLATGEVVSVGRDARWLVDGFERFAVAASGGIDVTGAVGDGTEVATLGELAYDPTISGLTATAGAFRPDPTESGADVREGNRFFLLPRGPGAARLSPSSLRAGYPTLQHLACNIGTPGNLETTTATLCLQPGGTVVDVDGNVVELGNGVMHLVPRTDTVELWAVDTTGDVQVSTTLPPATGVIFSAGDLVVGCGRLEGCETEPTTLSLTIAVGSPTAPATATIGGSLHTTPSGVLAVIATEAVLFPDWARDVDGNLHVDGHLTGLGYNGAQPTVGPDPRVIDEPFGTLTITGGIVGTDIDLGAGVFDTVSYGGDGSHWWWPSPGQLSAAGTWRETGRGSLSALDVCGQPRCDGW